MCSLEDNFLLPVRQEGPDPSQDVVPDPIVAQLVQETFVWDFVEGLAEVEKYDVDLVPSGKIACSLVNGDNKLCLTSAHTTEAMLTVHNMSASVCPSVED